MLQNASNNFPLSLFLNARHFIGASPNFTVKEGKHDSKERAAAQI